MRFRPLYLTKWPENNEKNLNRLYFFCLLFFFFFTHMEKLQLQVLNFTWYSWHLNSNVSSLCYTYCEMFGSGAFITFKHLSLSQLGI